MKVGTLLKALERDGCSAQAVPASRLELLKEDIESLRSTGALDEKVYNDYLLTMKYHIPADFPEARSIIVIAVPQPQLKIAFRWKGKLMETVVPPTYASAREVDVRVKKALTESVQVFVSPSATVTLPVLSQSPLKPVNE